VEPQSEHKRVFVDQGSLPKTQGGKKGTMRGRTLSMGAPFDYIKRNKSVEKVAIHSSEKVAAERTKKKFLWREMRHVTARAISTWEKEGVPRRTPID